MKKRVFARLSLFPMIPLIWATVSFAASGSLGVSSPCEKSEKWRFGDSIPGDARAEFTAFLEGRSSAARSLSEALAYRRDTPPGEPRAFSEYWIARTLLSAGLPTSAYSGFAAIVAGKRDYREPLTVPVAALRCMNVLGEAHPALEMPEDFGSRLSEMLALMRSSSERDRGSVREAAALLLKQQIQQERSKEEIRRTISLLRGGGAYENFSLGLWAALNGDQAGTAAEMERFLAAQSGTSSSISTLEKHVDQGHLLAARAYYAMGKYDLATRHLKLIRKSSNDLPQALSELSWSSLTSQNYGEAIGAAMGLQSGGIRHVFAPEGPMVLAMALNELCQYPESLTAINQFRRLYEPSYRWLSEWRQKSRTEREDLYPVVVAFLLKKKVAVPDRVASEWVRSPVFIASQEEFNLLSDERAAVQRTSRLGSDEQRAMGRRIQRVVQDVIPRFKADKNRGLSASLKSDLRQLIAEAGHYRRFRAAGPIWRALAANQEASSVALHRRAHERIDRDFAQRNTRMLQELEEIAENNRMLEVEIYDGASRDIIWQNAHPDYRQLVKEFSSEPNRVASSKVWNWGHAPITSDSWAEVWEDELGSVKSNLFNNCSNKEKYLAIKKGQNIRKSG